jgi:hypothetical protein
MIIKPNTLTINQLFNSNREQYVVPTYQRRYSWHERQVRELIDDIKLIEDNDTHLLGSIVCITQPHNAALNKLELVDGQQRLTTIVILLECIRQRFELVEKKEDAAEIARLLSAKPLNAKSVQKVALDSIDSVEFDWLVNNELGQTFNNLQLKNAFRLIREWIAEQTLEKLGSFLYRLQEQAIIIRLDVSEAKDAFKLFETINNRGLRLSPTDIIKNFLLGNAARFGDEALQSARASWTSIIQHLDGTNYDAFFRYYLMALLQVRITASDVVPVFKKAFMGQVREASALPERHLYIDVDMAEDDELDDSSEKKEQNTKTNIPEKLKPITFKLFLSRLVQSAKVYGELVLVKTNDQIINRHLRNLKMIKAVQTYGFLMRLRVDGCDDKNFRSILKLTESFVLRRHVCRERSNETESLFARMCGINPADPIAATKNSYRDLSPTDDKFQNEFATTSFTSNVIDRARYCLEQIEISKHSAHDELLVLGSADVHVEHIIPQKIRTKKAKQEFGDWVEYLGDKAEAEHSNFVSRIGNLTIFSGTLNIGASNNPFSKKKQAYEKSGIELTKELINMKKFKYSDVENRSKSLAEIAVKLWPKP